MKVNQNFSLSVEASNKLRQDAKDQNKSMSKIIEDFILSDKEPTN